MNNRTYVVMVVDTATVTSSILCITEKHSVAVELAKDHIDKCMEHTTWNGDLNGIGINLYTDGALTHRVILQSDIVLT